jgi:putative colanic acid biosysnthesis UDP-glucose lipid carrier transferase
MEITESMVNVNLHKRECVQKTSVTRLNQIAKRIFDIVFSLLVIVFIFPIIFPIVILLIKLDSKGHIFFIQKRNGLNNCVFHCIKFRTMVVNNEADKTAAVTNDQRITKFGKILRISSIDELPQFINVLKGEMSVVGPRPHMISDNLKFEKVVANYQIRHLVKPGITGLAQINGYKGHVNTVQDVKGRTIIDIKYVQNASLILDVRIIVGTIKLMVMETIRAKKASRCTEQDELLNS